MRCRYRTEDWCSVKAKTLTGEAECRKCIRFPKEVHAKESKK